MANSEIDLRFYLRRAEQETVAVIRSVDACVADLHRRMARAYSAKAQSLLGGSGDGGMVNPREGSG